NAIVRHLPAVETLGAVTVICSDKTGTLTGNVMTVRDVVTGSGHYAVEGVGYGAEGHIAAAGGGPAEIDADLRQLIRVVLLCNDACLHSQDGGVKLDGDPTEGALLSLGLKAGVDQRLEIARAPRGDSIPFESERRIMATLHCLPDGSALACLKGAPEAVLPLCGTQSRGEDAVDLDRAYWEHHAEQLAKGGERMIAAAYKTLPGLSAGLEAELAQGGFTLAGLCGLIDPPRKEAIQAIKSCREAHIRVKMITGDHGLTAKAIGTRMSLADNCRVLLGSAIEAMNDSDLVEAVRRHDIFARTSPEHKLRLVRALQSDGQVVAMTGDGVNDAPALKAADIGVAMGMKGSEVAKDAAVMVLADDNFASIAHAVEEGRTLHDNLLKAIVFILPTSFAQAGAVVVGLLLGVTLPITPLQILWVNLVTAVTLSVSLAFEPPESSVMKRPPRRPGQPLLGWFSLWRILFVTALLVAGLMGVYLYEMDHGAGLAASRTAAVNGLIVGEIVYLFNSRYIETSVLSMSGLFGNRYALLASALLLTLQLVMTYVPWVQELFGTAALGADAWLRIAAFGAAVFVVVEVEKLLLRLVKRCCSSLADGGERGAASRQNDRQSLTRFAWLSIAAAVVTIGLKTSAYYLTGSVGLLSDALESLVNLVAAMMALAMLVVAERPPDEEHHYGHGKAEYFSSGLEGALIMVAAAGIGIMAYDRLLHPQPLNAVDVGVAISCGAALINFWVASILMRVGRRYGSITLEADAHHLLTDVWTSLGVVTGLGAVFLTGWQVLDPIIALLVAAQIVWSGYGLLKRSVAGLLDATLPAAENDRISGVLDGYRQQGIEFHDLRTRQSGVHRFMTVHVLVPGSMTVQQAHALADRIEREIREAVGAITVVSHLEPLEDPASFNHEQPAAGEPEPGEGS
ncbi:MAG: HAD-IC family P-type ATPase, partial [Methylococcaceae bacterium]|nr:HAD-IC family P-type ATPase [Methylococcaceae bacterium]